MLNEIQALIKIQQLLDAAEVYKYEPTYAAFSGTIAMEAEHGAPEQSIVLTAVTAGTDGNDILLTGNGTDDLADLVAAWNAANPNNTVTLTTGTSTWLPSNAEAMQLAGALDAADTLNLDLVVIADEVKLSKMLDKMYSERYDAIAAKTFASYTEDELRIFYAECYYIAAAFLKKYALRYESEIFKRSYDYTTKTSTSEMSGKLYTANKYLETAEEFLKDIKFEKSLIIKQARLARY